MNTTSTHFVPPPRAAGVIHESFHQFGVWGDLFKGDINFNSKFDNQYEDTWQGTVGTSNWFEQEAIPARRTDHKIQRRLAQNREAARKSRLKKKAYVQQLETGRLKLIELEQELNRARQQQGLFVGGRVDAGELSLSSEAKNPEITAFEMEYGQWVEEQNRQVTEFRTALDAQINDIELRMLVDGGMSHYFELFRMKSTAAKADVFYVMSGMWKTSAERFFLWIGGFRPSDLLKVLLPHLDPLTEQQLLDVCNLKQSCQQAEDALSQGMDKLQLMLVESVAAGQMTSTVDRLEALVSFLNQADHLRQETLLQMNRVLTSQQAARGLLALGEYFQRLRTLSSLWATRPREPPNGIGVDQT